VEISENSENHLKAIVDGREVAGVDGFSDRAGKVAEKTQGEGKAAKNGARSWQSGVGSANCMGLPDVGGTSRPSPVSSWASDRAEWNSEGLHEVVFCHA